MQTVANRPARETATATMPLSLGFRIGATSVHTSRTMMLDELSLLLEKVDPNAKADAYSSAIIDENVLGKPTQTTRKRTAKRLTELYALSPACTLFRLLRHFWASEAAGRPMLAFLTAAARDPLLREATPFVLGYRNRRGGHTGTDRRTSERQIPRAMESNNKPFNGSEPCILVGPGRLPDRQGA